MGILLMFKIVALPKTKAKLLHILLAGVLAHQLTFHAGSSEAQSLTNGQNEIQIQDLSTEDELFLDEGRTIVLNHFSDSDRAGILSNRDKLSAINAILNSGLYDREDTVVLQALGVVFGDVLANIAGLRWFTHSDEYGSEPALIFEDTTVVVFPLTSISKRIERGEEVDVIDLLSGLVSSLQEAIDLEN